MTQPGNFSNIVPAGEDWLGRRFADIERRLSEMASTLSIQVASINADAFDIAPSDNFGTLFETTIAVPRGFTRAQLFAVATVTATRSLSTASNGGYMLIGLGPSWQLGVSMQEQQFPTPDVGCTTLTSCASSASNLSGSFVLGVYGNVGPASAWRDTASASIVGQVVFLR